MILAARQIEMADAQDALELRMPEHSHACFTNERDGAWL
jgi:hypothetical protein